MHRNSRLEKVIKSSRIKVWMLLQPYTFASSVQVKQGENSQWVQRKPGWSWVFLSALCLSGSIQRCPNACSNAQSKKAPSTLCSHHTLMWCDRSVPALLSAHPTLIPMPDLLLAFCPGPNFTFAYLIRLFQDWKPLEWIGQVKYIPLLSCAVPSLWKTVQP